MGGGRTTSAHLGHLLSPPASTVNAKICGGSSAGALVDESSLVPLRLSGEF